VHEDGRRTRSRARPSVTSTVTVTDAVTQNGTRRTDDVNDDEHESLEGVGKRGQSRAASYEVALGEAKELIVALDCVEIDELAPKDEVVAAQDLADRSLRCSRS
jgi:hypothetical protein